MKIDLSRIKCAFPSWPSELDVAKCETNWASLAQDFFCSASVLRNEMHRAVDLMHSVKNLELTVDILTRTHLSRPALFCMAFSLELAAKAARVRVARPDEFRHAKAMPFANHSIVEICDEIPNLSLNDAERQCLANAAEIIVNGKYPTDKRPRDDKTSFIWPDLESFCSVAEPLYQRLVSLACDAQPGSQQDAAQ